VRCVLGVEFHEYLGWRVHLHKPGWRWVSEGCKMHISSHPPNKLALAKWGIIFHTRRCEWEHIITHIHQRRRRRHSWRALNKERESGLSEGERERAPTAVCNGSWKHFDQGLLARRRRQSRIDVWIHPANANNSSQKPQYCDGNGDAPLQCEHRRSFSKR